MCWMIISRGHASERERHNNDPVVYQRGHRQTSVDTHEQERRGMLGAPLYPEHLLHITLARPCFRTKNEKIMTSKPEGLILKVLE